MKASNENPDEATPDPSIGAYQRYLIWEHWMQSPVRDGASDLEGTLESAEISGLIPGQLTLFPQSEFEQLMLFDLP